MPVRVGGFLLAVMVMLASVASFWGSWIDDSYITTRYARMLASGQGFVFNPGERVEGYTNFLWVVMQAVLQRLAGLETDITNWIRVLGIAIYAGMLAAVAFAAGGISRTRGAPAAKAAGLPQEGARRPVDASEGERASQGDEGAPSAPEPRIDLPTTLVWLFFLGVYTPFALYAVLGMETLAVAAAVTVAFCLWYRHGEPTMGSLAWFGVAALLRFDAMVLLAIGMALSLLQWRMLRRPWMGFVRMAAPVVAVYAVYHVWRVVYYGDVFPNTYYAKAHGRAAEIPPLSMSLSLWGQLGLWWCVPAVLVQFWFDVRRRRPVAVMAFLTCVLFQLYLTRLPLDWMFFWRMQMPIVPLILLLLAAALVRASRWIGSRVRVPRRVEPVLLAVLSVAVATRFFGPLTSQPIRGFYASLRVDQKDLTVRLERLSKVLSLIVNESDLLYTDIAGAPGYFTRARILDSWGLTDKTIAREGEFLHDAAGKPSMFGKIYPAYVARRQPGFLLMVTLGTDCLTDWKYIPPAVHCSRQLATIPDFLEHYRVGYVTDGQNPPLFCYFLQRQDREECHLPPGAPEGTRLEYEPLPARSCADVVAGVRSRQ